MACKSSEKIEKPKRRHRKGLWSPEEDQTLRNYVLKHGHGCWNSVPINAGLQRNGKSCRLRWMNYLRPGLKRGAFTPHEEQTILTLYRSLGNKWSQIALQLPGRTDNEMKNYWHSYLKKRVAKAEDNHPQLVLTNPECHQEYSSSSGEISGYGNSVQQQNAKKHGLLPKILFTEWLSLDKDNAQGGIMADCQSEAICSMNLPNYNSSLDGFMFDDFLFGERAFNGDYNSSEQSEGSPSDVNYSSQFNIYSSGLLASSRNDLTFM